MRVARSRVRALSVAWLALTTIVAATAQADSFRCDGRLITPGMPASTVIEHCGSPAEVEVVEVPILAKRLNGTAYQVGTQTIEYWTYDLGVNRFPARVTVEKGIARRIELQY